MEVAGHTTKGLIVDPVLHVYEPAPEAVRVVQFPEQIKEEGADMLTLMEGLTFMLTVACALQAPLVAVTV